MFELLFLTGARAGEIVQVVKPLIAGRSPDCSLEVPDANASRQHARILWDGAVLTMVDNGSSNGTYINDQRVPSAVLSHGDVIRLGETRLRVQLRSASLNASHQSSIFSFKEQEADLSQSLLLPMGEARAGTTARNADVLAMRLDAIIAMSKALTNINQLEVVFHSILDQLFKVFAQADRGFLMLLKEDQKLEPSAYRTRGNTGDENLTVSNSICKKAIESRSAFLFNDQNAAGFDQGMSIVSLKIHSAMTIPLMIDDKVLGLLQIDTHDPARSFTRDDLELAIAASQQAAIALNNALLLKKMEAEADQKKNLARFLPGALAEQVLTGQLDLAMGGKNYNATILFSDIIGFTSMSEGLSPEAVVGMMNAYFDRMVPCIRSTGSVDKFIGDAIMGVWGVPLDKGNAARDAVAAALAMQTALAGFNSQQQANNSPTLGMGIGLNSGAVVAGNIGTEEQKNYTVLGDTVNTAQRVEAAAGRDQILVSQATWDACSGGIFGIAMPPLKVKNKAAMITTFSVRGLAMPHDEVALHVLARSGTMPVWIIRRLADHSLVAIHPEGLDLCTAELVTCMAEWPEVALGKPEMVAVLPRQQADGQMVRSQIRLADEKLAGLLGDKPLVCTRDWDQMLRSSGG